MLSPCDQNLTISVETLRGTTSPKMDTFKERERALAEDNTQKKSSWTEELLHGFGREHAAALLDISEESSAWDLGSYDHPVESGWEEAVTGWGRYPPLACLLHAQKTAKKQWNRDLDYHCLLCAEIKAAKLSESNKSCRTNPFSSEDHQQTKGTPSMKFSQSTLLPRSREDHRVYESAVVTVQLSRKTPEDKQKQVDGETIPRLVNLGLQAPVHRETCCNIINILPPAMAPVRGLASGNSTISHILKKAQASIGGVPKEDAVNTVRMKSTVKSGGNMAAGAPAEEAAALSRHRSPSNWGLPTPFGSCMHKTGDAPFSSCVAAMPPISWLFGKQNYISTTASSNTAIQKIDSGKQPELELPLLEGNHFLSSSAVHSQYSSPVFVVK